MLGALVLAGVLILKCCTPTKPLARFEKVVQHPAPPSLRILEEGYANGIGFVFYAVRFEISSNDIAQLFSKHGVIPITNRIDYASSLQSLKYWTPVNLDTNETWDVFELGTNRSSGLLFWHSAKSQTVFILDRH